MGDAPAAGAGDLDRSFVYMTAVTTAAVCGAYICPLIAKAANSDEVQNLKKKVTSIFGNKENYGDGCFETEMWNVDGETETEMLQGNEIETIDNFNETEKL